MKNITVFILISFVMAVNLCNPCYAQYTKLHDFTGNPDGSELGDYFSFISDGTFLYGMTGGGGLNNLGTIFKIKPDGTGYTKLLDFAGISNGGGPNGSFISDGNFLYGMTRGGGTNNMGTIFKIKPDGTAYYKLHDFDSINGKIPFGSLFTDGTFFYGTTYYGGTYNTGTIFKIMTDGTGFTKLHDFAVPSGENFPMGSLISDGTFLYGTTYGANPGNSATVFKIKPDGTGYSTVFSFNNPVFVKPAGSLIYDGSFLYGMTDGGTNNMGTIFKIKTDGTGYFKILDFSGVSNGNLPVGSLISDGTFLYGTTEDGGTGNFGGPYGSGVAFKIKPDGTLYSKLVDFVGASNGANPCGSLFIDGNFLYGMTHSGGTGSCWASTGCGTIYKLGLTTGITENNEASDFSIYPNPCNGIFTIEGKENDYTIFITDILGQKIYQSEIKNNKAEIDLSRQPKGLYFMQITDENKSVVNKKIIIQ